ncbi:MAG: Bacterial regulatory protein luxR family, partial [Candidatus Eremiobacteraeota bacterium]|nr:Bacterial regulatory protein luxR family [Candidatus Eremiobacteraeota bacterium]
MDAWFAGNFEDCLHLCDAARVRDSQTGIHVALLRTRALTRLHRLDEALAALGDAAPAPYGSDEALTARMLAGELHVRRGDADAGLKLLLGAQSDMAGAHPTICSEIYLNIGLAHYALHDFAAADAALSRIERSADLVHARGIQYRAWVATARGESERAVSMFVRALAALDACRHHDRYFEANCVRALAHLSVERLERRTWHHVSTRRASIDWTSNALAEPRFFIAYCAATYELDIAGNPVGAAREGRFAENIAPSDAFRVQARCKRASIARHVGEQLGHLDHVESAAELFSSLDSEKLTGDEKIVPMILAEELAAIKAGEARALLELYRGLSALSPLRLFARSPVGEAYRRLVEAFVYDRAGDRHAAIQHYRFAYKTFRETGYVRRAVMAALGLWRLTADRDAYAYATSTTRHLPPQSSIRREVEAAKRTELDLTAVQREVLALICQGKSNPEIARLRKRSLHTIRNLVARLFEIFGVTSR